MRLISLPPLLIPTHQFVEGHCKLGCVCVCGGVCVCVCGGGHPGACLCVWGGGEVVWARAMCAVPHLIDELTGNWRPQRKKFKYTPRRMT